MAAIRKAAIGLGAAAVVVATVVGVMEIRKPPPGVGAAMDRDIKKLHEQAKRADPGAPESAALAQAGERAMRERMAQPAPPMQQQTVAADWFASYLLANTRARPDYCASMGVDISAFRLAFEQAHGGEIERLRASHSQRKIDIAQLYESLKAQMLGVVEIHMRDLSKSANGDVAETCRLFARNAASIVPQMHMSVNNPAVHKALMGP